MRLAAIHSLIRQLEDHHHFTDEVTLLEETNEGLLELDVERLTILCWGHTQYSDAQGFSASQHDVLRAIQSYDEFRVLTTEILASPWTKGVNLSVKEAAEQG